MRISTSVITPPIARDTREQGPLTSKSSDPAVTSASVVKLSSAGTAAASAEAAPAAAPTTTSRLQTIRAMLDKGDYPVDLDLLASRIVDDEVLRAGRP
jgi:anti-sigma28 factor (negative regulator of flagellin synthesis)